MKVQIISLITGILLSGPAHALSKSECLSTLQQLKSQNQIRMQELDSRITKALNQTPLQDEGFDKQMSDLAQQRMELKLRQVFLDRLILQVDHHYKGSELRSFLKERLVEMAKSDLTNGDPNEHIWKFLTYLSRAIDSIPERNENLLSFVEGYMNFSTLSAPIPPKEFLRSRQYTNGKDSFAANDLKKDEVGEVVENRLKALEKKPSLTIRAKASD